MGKHLLGALALALSLVTLAGPAHADAASGTVSGVNGVLYDDCRSYPYAYTVSVPSDAGYWELTTTLLGPDGRVTEKDYVARPSSGTSTFGLLCPPGDTYGRYTIRAVVSWGPDETRPTAGGSVRLADAHFTLRKPYTRTLLSASTRRPAGGQVVTYRVRSFDERPSGYAPHAFAWVHLEKRVGTRWVRLSGGRAMTHSTGAVGIRLRYAGQHRPTWLRAVTERSPRYAPSTSAVLRLW
jgi:hypothetical protein